MPTVELSLVSPLSGRVLPLEAASDPVFAGRMIGDGIAIEPVSGPLLAPCDGIVTHLHRAGHSITVTAPGGVKMLMHIGIDTIRLNGRGFRPAVTMGTQVRAGDVLIAFDAEGIAKEARSLQTMVILASEGSIVWRTNENVEAGKSLLMRVRLAESKGTERASTERLTTSAVAVVGHPGGIHARPAALVRAAAGRFDAEVSLELKGRTADVKSVIALMALAAFKDDRITVRASGAQAEAAVAAVVRAIESGEGSESIARPEVTSAERGSSPNEIRGVCAVPGVASGRIVRLDGLPPEPPEHSGSVDAEYDRLAQALARVRDEVAAEISKAEAGGAHHQRAILSTHLALLDDPEIVSPAERAVGAGASAGVAFRRAIELHCRTLSGLASLLLAGRAADLRDIERRVLLAMSGRRPANPVLFESTILVGSDIALSVFSALPRERIAALCTVGGGPTSHMAIVARAFGIPMIVALGPAVLSLPHGTEVLVDASAGRLDLAPDPARLDRAREAMGRRARREAEVALGMHAAAITRDGHTVEVAANVGSEEEARIAVRHGADGVGLLRTELLFVDRQTEPTEAEQRSAYQSVLDALEGRQAIIRTFDVGGDKPSPFVPLPGEENPALGLRGVRGDLARPKVLETQLRALLSLKPLASCKILLPMVTDLAELVAVQDRMKTLSSLLGISQLPPLGVMVEVPSAALLAEQLASRADFLSIGTNDLVQYTLAMDRRHPVLASRQDGLHPAVLRLVAKTVEGAARRGKWVGVCGVLASDPEAVPVLLGLGIAELSVSPAVVPEIKARVRSLDYYLCRREVPALLDLTSSAEVRARVRKLWPEAE